MANDFRIKEINAIILAEIKGEDIDIQRQRWR